MCKSAVRAGSGTSVGVRVSRFVQDPLNAHIDDMARRFALRANDPIRAAIEL